MTETTKSLRGEIRRSNAQKNREHPAQTRSGRTNQRYRGAKRDPGHVEVCAYRGGLATALGHRRSDQDDCRRQGVPGLCTSEENRWAEKAKAITPPGILFFQGQKNLGAQSNQIYPELLTSLRGAETKHYGR